MAIKLQLEKTERILFCASKWWGDPDMPEDMQKWLKAEGGMKYALKSGQALEDGAKVDTKWMEDQGHKFYYVSDADREAALAPLASFAEVWKNEECKGMDPKVVEEVYAFALERSKFHTEQFRAGKYGNYAPAAK